MNDTNSNDFCVDDLHNYVATLLQIQADHELKKSESEETTS